MKNLTQILKDFDEQFEWRTEPINIWADDIKSFLTSAIQGVLEEVTPEEYNGWEKDVQTGFNACRNEVKENIRKLTK